MMKKVLTVLASFCIAVCLFSVVIQAEELQEGDYKYQILEDGTAEITDYIGSEAEVEIPGVLGGYQVTSIGEYAFYKCYNMQNVIIPDGILKIDAYSFIDCRNLIDIRISDSVMMIGDSAFEECDSLTAITIPKGVTTIGENVFSLCRALERIDVSEENLSFSSVDGVLLSKDGTKLVLYPRNKMDETYTTPETVTIIARSSFVVNDNLQEIILSKNVETIEAYAFQSCNNLNKIVLSENTSTISGISFDGCRNINVIEVPDNNKYLESVDGVLFNEEQTILIKYPSCATEETYTIPDSVVMIGDGAFIYCTSLSHIDMSDNVTTIGDAAFLSCESLLELQISENVTYIGKSAFSRCYKLETINIPDGITCIKKSTFSGCSSLEEIVIPDSVNSIEDYAFCVCENLKSIIIPDHVTIIGNYAFESCYSLENVILSDNLISIGESAFEFCALTSITIPDNVTNIGEHAFSWNPFLCTVILPESVMYIEDAAFAYCNKITNVFYKGNEDLWNKIEIGMGNIYLTDANIHYEASTVSDIFQDINENEWFFPAIDYVYKNNIMTGLNQDSFAPYDTLVRAQFASVLYSANNLPDVTFEAKFSDVMEDDWYADAVIWANKNGIVNGYGSGAFGPGDAVTREQMAIMMYNYAVAQGYANNQRADITTFADAGLVSWYAEEAMQWAVGSGVITGKDEGTRLDPQGSASRAECAVIMQRFMEAQGA